MSIEDRMTIDERRKYLRKMQERYLQAGRKERGQLLDEMEAVTELHRKSVIRLMKGNLTRRPRRKQRSRTIGADVDDALRVIAEKPEHCHDCYRLIQASETYYLTIDNAVLCPDCIRATDAIRLAGGLTVEVGEDRLLVRRGDDVVEALPGEVRHLVDALVEFAEPAQSALHRAGQPVAARSSRKSAKANSSSQTCRQATGALSTRL